MSAKSNGQPRPPEKVCGARRRSDGEPCQEWKLKGRKRCRKHGGLSTGPISSGRRARMAQAFGALYEHVATDPLLLDLTPTLSLTLIREHELIERLGAGDTPAFRQKAFALYQEVRAATRARDTEAIQDAMERLETLLKAGADRDEAWAKLEETGDRHARLVEQHTRIETAKQNIVTNVQFRVFAQRMFEFIRLEAGEDVAYRVGRRLRAEIEHHLDTDRGVAALPPANDAGA